MLGEIKYSCALNKLMAVAFFRAEVERAASEGREVDFARSNVSMEKTVPVGVHAEDGARALVFVECRPCCT